MYKIILTIAACVALAQPLAAQEATTASGQDRAVKSIGAEVSTKFDTYNTAQTAIMNALTAALRTCAQRNRLYNPGGTGNDADGCRPIAATAPEVVLSTQYETRRNVTRNMGSSWDFCSLHGYSNTEENGSCRVRKSGADWILDGDNFNHGYCWAQCFRFR